MGSSIPPALRVLGCSQVRKKDPIKVALKDFKRTPTPVHRVVEVDTPEWVQARAAEPEDLPF
ncbi:hypothetical protein ASD05_27910 [Variovorax sp. Root434]|nr:hypothetical protein ASD05_27910 [Variovorax sp. Root434]